LATADAAAIKRARDLRDQMQLRDEPVPERPQSEPAGEILSDYDEAFRRAGRPKGFFERQVAPPQPAAPSPDWKQFSAADLLAKYPPKHPKQDTAE